MWRQFKKYSFYGMILTDTVIFCIALVGAYFIRLDYDLAARHIRQIKHILAIGIPIRLFLFTILGLYRGIWRYTGFKDLVRLFRAVVMSELLIIAVTVFRFRFDQYSRVVFFVDGMLTFMMTAGVRMAMRWFSELKMVRKKGSIFRMLIPKKGKKENVIIIGAGDAGMRILNEVHDNPGLRYHVACFLDNDPHKKGRTLRGVPVFGAVADLPAAIERYNGKRVFIAIPSATGAQMRSIVEVCEKALVPFKTLPTISEIIDERVSIKALRDVDYQDLLGRPAVVLDTEGIDRCISGKRILITGCGGSIGSELCRQVLRFQPESLYLLDSCEFNLYQIEKELRDELDFEPCTAILGQVQDEALVTKVFETFHPDVVFHAAAYKHVPMLELNPWEAVSNNIKGSLTVMQAAVRHKASRFVLVSTDKAVRPTNIMGASKRVAELVMQSLSTGTTKFVAVRFGNVLGSTGSVVPLFRRQIERGGPVTVTHPEVTRYFMTIPEASQLILQAMSMGEGKEVFVLEMGTPVKIVDMARDLIKLSGRDPDKDIKIIFTGLRPGEKLYEELITGEEDVYDTQHDKIKLLKVDHAANGTDLPDVRDKIERHLAELFDLSKAHNAPVIRQKLKDIVPEFTFQDSEPIF